MHSQEKVQVDSDNAIKVELQSELKRARILLKEESGTLDSTFKLVNSIIERASEKNFDYELAEALAIRGQAKLTVYAPIDEPTFDLLKSLTLFTKIEDKEGMADCYIHLGVLNYDVQNYNAAIKYFMKLFELESVKQSQIGMAHYLLALSFSELGNYEESSRMFDLAEDDFKNGNPFMNFQIETFKGKLLVNQGEIDKAIIHLNSLLELAEKNYNETNLAPLYSFIAEAYLKDKQFNLAISTANIAFEMTGENKRFSIYKMEAERTLHHAYHAIGNNDSAYYYLNLLAQENDLAVNNRALINVAELTGEFEIEQVVIQEKAKQDIKDAEAKQKLERQKLVRNFLIGAFVISLIFVVVFLKQKKRIASEKKRSDALLLNILPEEVAEELKEKGAAEARLIDLSTVLFTDFKGFTALSEILSPQELVHEINICFSAFDHIMTKHNIEKIKTIGDAYMAAGGLPTENKTHPKDVVKAAVEIQGFMLKHAEEKKAKNEPFFEIRIGVHTGPVVAGIVGVKKFQYDIWGDTVNTASRMESSGEVGKVNISETTYLQVKDEFDCEFRGKIEAKGKGQMNMYFVNQVANIT